MLAKEKIRLIEEAKQAINEYVLGIIGKDEPDTAVLNIGKATGLYTQPDPNAPVRNTLRNQQRKRMEL